MLFYIQNIYLFLVTNVIMWYNQTVLIAIGSTIVHSNNRTTIGGNYSIKIMNVQPADQGTYLCNILPSNASLKVNLVVKTKPIATIYNTNGRDISGRSMTVYQGEQIEVLCKGVGQPKPEIKWFANGERVGQGHGIHVIDGTLIIKHADHHHVRLYQCLADNDIGVGHATVNINVQCKIIFI